MECGVPDCNLPVNLECDCNQRLAELCVFHHIYMYRYEQHSLPYVPLSMRECELLQTMQASLRWRVSLQQWFAHQELQAELEPLLSEYHRQVRQHSRKVQKLLERYSAIQESLSQMLEARVVGQTNAFSSALFDQLNQGALTIDCIESVLAQFDLSGKNWAVPSDDFIVSAEHNRTQTRSLQSELTTETPALPQGAAIISATPQHLVIAGGKRGTELLDEVTAVYPAWGQNLTLPALRRARSQFALAKYKHYLVATGGHTTDGPTNSCEYLGNTRWMSFPSLNLAREAHSACSLNMSIYIAGGSNSSLLDSIEKLGTSGRWRVLSLKLPRPCQWPGFLVDGDKLLVAGGISMDERGTQQLLDEVAVSTTTMRAWNSRPKLLQPFCFLENTWTKWNSQAHSFGTYLNARGFPQKMQVALRLE